MRLAFLIAVAACSSPGASPAPEAPSPSPAAPTKQARPTPQPRQPVTVHFGAQDSVSFAALTSDGLVTVVPTLREPFRYRGATFEPGIYILRFDAAGELRKSALLCSNTEGSAVAGGLNRDGALVVAGAFARTLTFAGKSYQSEGDWDAFVLYDAPDGSDWATTFGGAAR